MAKLYKQFAVNAGFGSLDFSDEAKFAQFQAETHGAELPNKAVNGFTYGQFAVNVTVAMWKHDLSADLRGEPRTLFTAELYAQYPKWFIDRVVDEPRRMNKRDIAEFKTHQAKIDVKWNALVAEFRAFRLENGLEPI